MQTTNNKTIKLSQNSYIQHKNLIGVFQREIMVTIYYIDVTDGQVDMEHQQPG